jgi:hypothetical protein
MKTTMFDHFCLASAISTGTGMGTKITFWLPRFLVTTVTTSSSACFEYLVLMALGGAVTVLETLCANAASGVGGAREAFENHLVVFEYLRCALSVAHTC